MVILELEGVEWSVAVERLLDIVGGLKGRKTRVPLTDKSELQLRCNKVKEG